MMATAAVAVSSHGDARAFIVVVDAGAEKLLMELPTTEEAVDDGGTGEEF